MALSQIVLDDRNFQELVNEARLRITRTCPEWTEHNVSDPGITLIELFAWMTEMLIYRVNRIPDKLHVALLELLGIGLEPPSAATAELRFRLAAPPQEPIAIPAGETEVGTLRRALVLRAALPLAALPHGRPHALGRARDEVLAGPGGLRDHGQRVRRAAARGAFRARAARGDRRERRHARADVPPSAQSG